MTDTRSILPQHDFDIFLGENRLVIPDDITAKEVALLWQGFLMVMMAPPHTKDLEWFFKEHGLDKRLLVPKISLDTVL